MIPDAAGVGVDGKNHWFSIGFNLAILSFGSFPALEKWFFLCFHPPFSWVSPLV